MVAACGGSPKLSSALRLENLSTDFDKICVDSSRDKKDGCREGLMQMKMAILVDDRSRSPDRLVAGESFSVDVTQLLGPSGGTVR